ALEIEVLQLFIEQAPSYLDMLRQATTEKAGRDAAHTIKGSARAVGAMRVGSAAEAAEALKGSTDELAKLAAADQIEECLAEAGRFIAVLTEAPR
ncbi:MAG: Hpt domain-containing protein, partial [Proteobacteria bacterium]|nr:Hpt domain-containing protein [Pseudomonadota bacterium]